MKKLFLSFSIILIFLILLCGCGNNWRNHFEFSEINIKTIKSFNDVNTYVSGKIKNNSKKTCNALWTTIEFKSGTLTAEESVNIITIDEFKPGDIIEYEESINHKNYENYYATFKNIECSEKLDTN